VIHMAALHKVLLLSKSSCWRDRWMRELGDVADARAALDSFHISEGDMPDLIVTDSLPVSSPVGEIAELVSRGEIGVIGIGTTGCADVILSHDYTGRELRLGCQLMAEVVHLRRRMAVELRSQHALRKMAYSDPLTGLANRRKWDQELVSRMERLRGGGPEAVLGIALLDLDLFKRLNDQFGHTVGDTVLRRVGQKLMANLSEQHLAARLGGDEFGILLSEILPNDVSRVVDLIRRTLECRPEDVGAEVPTVTISAGVVLVAPTDVAHPPDALQAVSRALLAAKGAGRNQTVMGSLAAN